MRTNSDRKSSSDPQIRTLTSESVTIGHPDKLCDQISDAVLDAFLEGNARVACEAFVMAGKVVVAGEFRTSHSEFFVRSN